MIKEIMGLNFNLLFFIGIIFGIIGLVLLVFFLVRIYRKILKLVGKYDKETGGFLSNIFLLLGSLVLIFFSTTIFWLLLALRTYQVFTREEVIGIIKCSEIDEERMRVEFTPISGKEFPEPKTFILSGNQWCAEGYILKWQRWLNFLGVNTCHKITRITGRYVKIEDETRKPHSAHQIDEEDGMWRFLMRYGDKFPFVEAVYGNSVFTFPEDEKIFYIYITQTGFIIKKE